MNIGIIGLGLIGGSLGRALTKKTGHKVLGSDIDYATTLKAELLGAFHERLDETNISDIDILFLALRPAAAIQTIKDTAPKLKSGAIIIDCCGTKRGITAEMKKLSEEYLNLYFIGGHPMAGREFSGINHSMPSLFEKASMIITPVNAPIEVLAEVKSLFSDIGFAGTVITTPQRHDRIIAYTSQLAHVVSSAYVKSPSHAEHAGFSAGSFRDMTRVAKLNPAMWTELFLDNKDNLIKEIDTLITNITAYRDALKAEDAAALEALLAEGVACKEAAESACKEKIYD